MKLFDLHNHSEFSFDSKGSTVLKTALAAREKGLGGFAVTDHFEYYSPAVKEKLAEKEPETFDVSAQQAAIDKARLEVPGIEIFKGIEVGLCSVRHDDIRAFLAPLEFDQITVSVHNLDDMTPFMKDYYIGKTWREAYGRYLEYLYQEMVWFEDFDVMGHYDYVTRYPDYGQVDMLYRDFPDLFDAIFKYLIENGKALEINTKSYQLYKGRHPQLDENVLRRYRDMGGEIVAFGSDSHDSSLVGLDFEKYAAILRSCGFRYLAHYSNRRLVMSSL